MGAFSSFVALVLVSVGAVPDDVFNILRIFFLLLLPDSSSSRRNENDNDDNNSFVVACEPAMASNLIKRAAGLIDDDPISNASPIKDK